MGYDTGEVEAQEMKAQEVEAQEVEGTGSGGTGSGGTGRGCCLLVTGRGGESMGAVLCTFAGLGIRPDGRCGCRTSFSVWVSTVKMVK